MFSTDKSKSHDDIHHEGLDEENEDNDDEDAKEDFLLALFIAQQDSQGALQSSTMIAKEKKLLKKSRLLSY